MMRFLLTWLVHQQQLLKPWIVKIESRKGQFGIYQPGPIFPELSLLCSTMYWTLFFQLESGSFPRDLLDWRRPSGLQGLVNFTFARNGYYICILKHLNIHIGKPLKFQSIISQVSKIRPRCVLDEALKIDLKGTLPNVLWPLTH